MRLPARQKRARCERIVRLHPDDFPEHFKSILQRDHGVIESLMLLVFPSMKNPLDAKRSTSVLESMREMRLTPQILCSRTHPSYVLWGEEDEDGEEVRPHWDFHLILQTYPKLISVPHQHMGTELLQCLQVIVERRYMTNEKRLDDFAYLKRTMVQKTPTGHHPWISGLLDRVIRTCTYIQKEVDLAVDSLWDEKQLALLIHNAIRMQKQLRASEACDISAPA